MKGSFILSCESTVDMPHDYVASRDIPVLFYSYMVDDRTYTDDMGRDPQALPQFYGFLSDGKLPSTSQLNEFQYETFFDELLQQGDVLHIAFGTGMTNSYYNAEKAAEIMRGKYPDRKIVVIDSLCSCSGYGMLVDYAADMRDNAATLEEVEQWVLANRKNVRHDFFSTDLKYFRRSGRVSGPSAMLGSMLNICPLMHLNEAGKIVAYDKVRGKKKALERTLQTMVEHAENGTEYNGKCYISHSNCPEDAEELKKAINSTFPKLGKNICVFNIGTIIASHCGPGTVALFFMGDRREE